MKRIISFFLILIMLFSFPCISSSAATSQDPPVPQIEITTDAGNGLSLEKADGYVGAHITITDADGSAVDDTISLKVRGNRQKMGVARQLLRPHPPAQLSRL